MNQDISIQTALKKGQILLLPTDTVWGVCCDASNEASISRIITKKGKEAGKGLVNLVSDIEMLSHYVVIPKEIKPLLFSSSPTTILFESFRNLPKICGAKDGSIAFRVVQSPFCKKVITSFQSPLASTSANIHGEKTPSCFSEISQKVLSFVDFCTLFDEKIEQEMTSRPSKIIKVEEKDIIILRK